MNKRLILLMVLAVTMIGGIYAQTTRAGAVNDMTLNGSTGLILVPDAHIGWENANLGVDIGYGFVYRGGDRFDNLPRFSVSFLKKFEVSGLFQIQDGLNNFVLGAKWQLFKKGSTALALGGDFEFLNSKFKPPNGDSSKVYFAATYGGNFFSLPAVTTATVGWQFLNNGDFSSQFIYGMGFSLSLFPKTFNEIVYWVTDFSNFSYTVVASEVNTNYRGAFNTGVRIHPIKSGRFNLVIDVVGIDLLDDGNRGLMASISGGMAF